MPARRDENRTRLDSLEIPVVPAQHSLVSLESLDIPDFERVEGSYFQDRPWKDHRRSARQGHVERIEATYEPSEGHPCPADRSGSTALLLREQSERYESARLTILVHKP